MQTADDVRKRSAAAVSEAWVAACLACALESGLVASLDGSEKPVTLAPELADAISEVLVEAGYFERRDGKVWLSPGLAELATPDRQRVLAAAARVGLMRARRLLDRSASLEAPFWDYTEPELVDAQGLSGVGVAHAIAAAIIPSLDGLLERLRVPGSVLLDVGSGAGWFTIVLCGQFPGLRAVGLDPKPDAIELARANALGEHVAERIEFLPLVVQDWRQPDVFDLAWLPVPFIPDAVVDRALNAVRQALRPGGWRLVAVLSGRSRGLARAVSRLGVVLSGGAQLTEDDLVPRLRAAGYAHVRCVAAPSLPSAVVVVGQRPETLLTRQPEVRPQI